MLIGSDPELFLKNAKGMAMPASILFDTKKKKTTLKGLFAGYGYTCKAFRDGFAVELNPAPSTCIASVCNSIFAGIQQTRKLAKEKELDISLDPAVRVNPEELVKLGLEDLLEFGCDPSLNAYSGKAELVPLNGSTHPYRYAGGHIHFSGDLPIEIYKDQEACQKIVKLLDLYVGLPMSVIFRSPLQYLRRRYYGKAGEFRMQKYPGSSYYSYETSGPTHGLEYRTLGPEILSSSGFFTLAAGIGRAVLSQWNSLWAKWDPAIEDDLRGIINEGQKGWAKLFKPTMFVTSEEMLKLFRAKGRTIGCEFDKIDREQHHNWPQVPWEWKIPVPFQGAYLMRDGSIFEGPWRNHKFEGE